MSDMYLFTDDTKLLQIINNVQDAIQLQQDISAMENWCKDWLLKFHLGKSHVLTLGKLQNIQHAHPYAISDSILKHVAEEFWSDH